MVLLSFCVLAVGLSGSLALPNPLVDPTVNLASTNFIVPREVEEVDPSTCPTIKCASEFHPLYNPDTKRCSCEADTPAPSKCPKIVCASGTSAHWVAGDATCTCKVVYPVPSTCPQMKCKSEYHVVYHPELDSCSCDQVCPDLMCIATMILHYDETTKVCSCQSVPGLENTPNIARGLEDRDDSIPPRGSTSAQCANLMCIDEKYPWFNGTTGKCECVYHPELAHPFFCGDTICIAEKEAIYNTSSGVCYCEWLPALLSKRATLPLRSDEESPTTPTPVPTQHHRCPKIHCIDGQNLVVNATTGICSCEAVSSATPLPSSPISNFASSLPKIDSVPACFNMTSNQMMTCPDPRETPHWVSGKCICNSSTSSTSTTKIPTHTPKPTSTSKVRTTHTHTVTSPSKPTTTFQTSTTTC